MAGTAQPYDLIKRLLDIVASAAALVLLSPVIALVAITVALRLGRPVLFVQPRPGRDGRVFLLRKFRSMRDVDEARGLVSDADRLTSFGRALRATSLDELPSLWNVLRGDMSIVGPRPLLVEYLPRYTPQQARRHEVRPGITGLAQANGRNALSWEDKFALDVEYVDNRSLGLDARIILATLRAVIVREGISAEGQATMTKFGEASG
ncbi:sugar transferase [Microbacterium sp. USTB-Y]|uniref:sugar transferase n=1 Tax=Microbacterium sp. USTB-Y TaxID=2823692 RepID=UPI0027E3328E|nr:sugar transferase [Microbacterium sp. USTB-Y]